MVSELAWNDNNDNSPSLKSKDGWNGMDVMFAMFINENEKQLIEYVVIKDNVI